MKIFWYALTVVACYLIGNINFALIISKFKNSDIRKQDSGNPGAMNMLRNFGTGLGALTLFFDALKGAAAAVLGWFILGDFKLTTSGYKSGIGMFIGGACVIVGHVYPVFLGFKGGKGIASTIGVCLVLNPIITLISFAAGALFLFTTKKGSITSFIIISFPLALKCLSVANDYSGANKYIALSMMIFIFLLTLWAHRSNLKKMFLGTERKTNAISKKKTPPAQTVENAQK